MSDKLLSERSGEYHPHVKRPPIVSPSLNPWFPSPGAKAPLDFESGSANLLGLEDASAVPWLMWKPFETGQYLVQMIQHFAANSIPLDPAMLQAIARVDLTGEVPPAAGELELVLAAFRRDWYPSPDGGDPWAALARFTPEERGQLYGLFFAFGPIELCVHLCPAGHCAKALEGGVPIPAAKLYVALTVALLAAGRSVHLGRTGRPPGVWLEPIDRILKFGGEIWPVDWESVTSTKETIAAVVTRVLRQTEAHPLFTWTADADVPQTEFYSDSPFISQLMLQVADALSVPDVLVPCSNPDCGTLIDLRKRRRKPLPNQKPWCDRCRAAGVHKRDSEQQLRQKSRQKAQED